MVQRNSSKERRKERCFHLKIKFLEPGEGLALKKNPSHYLLRDVLRNNCYVALSRVCRYSDSVMDIMKLDQKNKDDKSTMNQVLCQEIRSPVSVTKKILCTLN